MKKFNKNIILFLIVYGLVIAMSLPIVFSSQFFSLVADNIGLLKDREISVISFVQEIKSGITSRLHVHDEMMDLYSMVMRFTGTEVVIKEDGTTIVRADNNLLSEKSEYVDNEELDKYADSVEQLCIAAQNTGAAFLYVQAPAKGYEENYPGGVDNYEKSNYDRFAQALNQRNIPLLNLREEMAEDGLTDLTAFYATDHHWKVETGFWAYSKICDRLNSDYGFEYDTSFTDINNYDVKIYEDWFLGSQGKKVGRWFTPRGADDIALITPKFETNLEESHSVYEASRSGKFEDSVLFLGNIETKGYYEDFSPYVTYSGGDFRLQIMKNNMLPNGKKVLVIRDSFACPVTPFLSLVTSEIHITDTRNFQHDDKFSVFEYMEEFQPDYVIVLYNSIGHEISGRFDFG